MSENTYLLGLFTRIFAWYHLFLIISAFILNPLVFYVCLRSRRLRSTSTFKLLAICSVNDLLSCLEWNQADFLNPIFNLNLSGVNLLFCRWVTFFLQHITLEYASWMLVLISADRFFSMALKKMEQKVFQRCQAVLVCPTIDVNNHLNQFKWIVYNWLCVKIKWNRSSCM